MIFLTLHRGLPWCNHLVPFLSLTLAMLMLTWGLMKSLGAVPWRLKFFLSPFKLRDLVICDCFILIYIQVYSDREFCGIYWWLALLLVNYYVSLRFDSWQKVVFSYNAYSVTIFQLPIIASYSQVLLSWSLPTVI